MLTKIYLDIHVFIGAIAIGAWSIVWVEILTAGPFNFLYQFWYKLFDQKNLKQVVICEFLATPLFECAVCHAGWIAIFLSILLSLSFYHFAVAVSVSMATAFFITKQTTEK